MQKGLTEHEYLPGSCNIGQEEISRRYRIGYLGLALTALLILVIEILDGQRAWRFLICGPVALSLIGFLQAIERFCFAYGFRAVFSTKGFRILNVVSDPEFARLDRQKAILIVTRVVLGTLIATIGYYLLPASH